MPVPAGKVGLHAGEGAAIVEGDEFGDDGLNVLGGDLLERADDGGICGCGVDGLPRGELLLRVKKAGAEKRKGDDKTAEMREEAGTGDHEVSPCGKTKNCQHRMLDEWTGRPLNN